jgi:hypothetical protein
LGFWERLQELKIIRIYNLYKIIETINIENILKIKYYMGEEFVVDYGKSYYERIEIINKNKEIIFNYKTKQLNFICEELLKENIIVESIDENE